MIESEGSPDTETSAETVTEDIYAFREPSAIGVSFRRSGKVYYFAPNGLKVRQGDAVLAQTEKGVDIGEVVFVKYERLDPAESKQLKPLLRKATAEDLQQEAELQTKEREARRRCEAKVAEHQLPMRIVAADYTFDRSRLTFYFSAEGRVDFRNLVKDLAETFRTRIELRQIGVRDQAKMIGGLGPCGRPLCCNAWLRNFDPVGIRVAKDQGLSLNPAKISGICDRLMCCLRYEHETYQELSRRLPKPGQIVNTVKGPAVVKSVVLMHERVTVEYPDNKTEVLNASQIWAEGADMPEEVRQAAREPVDDWATTPEGRATGMEDEEPEARNKGSRRRRRRKPSKGSAPVGTGQGQPQEAAPSPRPSGKQERATEDAGPPPARSRPAPDSPPEAQAEEATTEGNAAKRRRRRPRYRSRTKGSRPAED